MARVDYVAATMRLRDQIKVVTGEDPVEYVSRPGGGDPPVWHFADGYAARGGHAAESYLRGWATGRGVGRA